MLASAMPSLPAIAQSTIFWSIVQSAFAPGEVAGTRSASFAPLQPSAKARVLPSRVWIGGAAKPPTGTSKSRYWTVSPVGLLCLSARK